MYGAFGLGHFFALFFYILAISAIVARNCWRALCYESYDKRSYRTNLMGLVVSLVLFTGALTLMISVFNWLDGSR